MRNKEIGRLAGALAGAGLAAAGLGWLLGGPAAGWAALAAAAAESALCLGFTARRYRRLADLAGQIDRVLHDAETVFISTQEEGELAILESELAKTTQRIREQNRALQREKSRLAEAMADIAHQLRTPLTSCNLVLALLEQAPDPARRLELLREAEALFARMDWLLDALLKLSRLEAGIVPFASGPVALDALVDRALQPLAVPLELRRVTVVRQIPAGAVWQGDAAWLAEAVQNILKNSLENAGEGGRIEIGAADTPLYTELTVRDSGPGIAEKDLPHLFDRFYRGQTGSAGYGIGLALCRQIVADQGGSVSARNHPGGGAVFRVRFPKPLPAAESDDSLTGKSPGCEPPAV